MNLDKKNLLSLVGLSVLALGLFVSSKLVTQNTENRSQAVSNSASVVLLKKPILAITLLINRDKNSVVVQSVERMTGSIPDYRNVSSDYIKVDLTNSVGTKRTLSIALPEVEVYAPPRDLKAPAMAPRPKLTVFTQTIFLPDELNTQVSISKAFSGPNKSINSINFSVPSMSANQIQLVTNGQKTTQAIKDNRTTSIKSPTSNYQIETIYDGNPLVTDPLQTLDIVMVSSGFTGVSQYLFRDFTFNQLNWMIGFSGLPGKSPYAENKKIIKVRRLVTNETYHQDMGNYINVDYDKVIRTLASLGIPFDQYSIVLNADGRSWATLGGMYNVLFRTWYGTVERNLLYAHEFTHSFAGVLDEYIEQSGGSYLNDLNKNCKEDPKDPWVHNIAAGAYVGCNYYSNLFRPDPSSLMVSLDNNLEFNEPTKYLITKAFKAYTANEVVPVIYPNVLRTYIDKSSSGDYYFWVGTRPLGLAGASYHSYFSPEVDWLYQSVGMDGYLGGNITFQSDSSKLTKDGIYKTNLIIEINNDSNLKQVIPITLAIGTGMGLNDISLNRLPKTIFYRGETMPVSVTIGTSLPGFKRVEYYYKDPWYDSSGFENIFDSRTSSPYGGIFSAFYPYDPSYNIDYGTYTLFAKGIYYWNGALKSNSYDVEIVARGDVACRGYNYGYGDYGCSVDKISRRCFKGTSDCGGTYCCPGMVSPTVTPTPTCLPRPGCLSSRPACKIPEPVNGWCPSEFTPTPIKILPSAVPTSPMPIPTKKIGVVKLPTRTVTSPQTY